MAVKQKQHTVAGAEEQRSELFEQVERQRAVPAWRSLMADLCAELA
jgi:hypothetical protein